MIKIINFDEFDNLECLLSKKSKEGVISSNFSSDENDMKLYSDNTFKHIDIPITYNISSEEINGMNIIINNNNCSETFFNKVCQKLDRDGIVFTSTNNCSDINKDNSTVITLDQQYSSGETTLIFAPYSNTRLGNSDSLAISMKSAFEQGGFLINSILCSKIGFEKDGNGEIKRNIATDTEKSIDEDNDTSFVTISFGTFNINADIAAKCIENGLARQKRYLNSYDNNNDLIYSASSNDSVEEVSKYFGTSSSKLTDFNNIKNNAFFETQAVINPNIEKIDVFNKCNIFEIFAEKTKTY